MIVGDSWEDRSWQVHCDGLLALISQRTHEQGVQSFATSNVCSDDVCMLPSLADFDKAWRLLDTAKFQLKEIAPEMDSLLSGTRAPRKLDARKLHIAVKKIFKNLWLVSAVLSPDSSPSRPHLRPSLPPTAAKQIEYRSLLIIMTDFLLKTGPVLHSSGQNYRQTKEFTRFFTVLQDSVDDICASVPAYFRPAGTCPRELISPTLAPDSAHTMEATKWIWPLYCASKAACSPPALRQWIQEVLWTIGEQSSLPRAMALVRHSV
jgi:hypothetical protein